MKSFLSPLTNKSTILTTLAFSLSYLLFHVVLFNYQTISQLFTIHESFSYKAKLLMQLLTLFPLMFPPIDQLFFSITTILIGFNGALAFILFRQIKNSGKLKWSFGGLHLIAVAGSGCSGCGLSIFSVLGPSAGFLDLSLHSTWSRVAIIALLFLSTLLTLRKLQKNKVCAMTSP